VSQPWQCASPGSLLTATTRTAPLCTQDSPPAEASLVSVTPLALPLAQALKRLCKGATMASSEPHVPPAPAGLPMRSGCWRPRACEAAGSGEDAALAYAASRAAARSDCEGMNVIVGPGGGSRWNRALGGLREAGELRRPRGARRLHALRTRRGNARRLPPEPRPSQRHKRVTPRIPPQSPFLGLAPQSCPACTRRDASRETEARGRRALSEGPAVLLTRQRQGECEGGGKRERGHWASGQLFFLRAAGFLFLRAAACSSLRNTTML